MTDPILASPTTLKALKGVPLTFRWIGKWLLTGKTGQLKVRLPDGRELRFYHDDEGPEASIDIHDYAFAKRSFAGGDVGFGESYMDGQWSTPDLTAVLRYFSDNFDASGDGRLARGGFLRRLTNMLRHMLNRNSKTGSQRNIYNHYDIGNTFYAKWLDPSMTYSAALYNQKDVSLESAQKAKYDAICRNLKLSPDSDILEIGCGWGGFAEYAASQYGAKLTCLTISKAQQEYARERLHKAGLAERVDIRLQDYRDHSGTYDGVASIEMFEAVGESYWPSYFSKVHEALKPGGKATLQIITIDDDLFQGYRQRADFIQRYIFPGGMMPSEKALRKQLEKAGLSYDSVNYFGLDYAKTLKIWADNFNKGWEEICQLGFDESFRRMWNFYLSYCQAGFEGQRINVGQFSIIRPH